MPKVNLQALVALLCFGVSLVLARIVVNIHSGKFYGTPVFVFYLRIVLGFVFAAAIYLGWYSFMGVNVIFK